MNDDDFQKHLQRTPLREVPAQWRGEILKACGPLASSATHRKTSDWWRNVLWPCPQAWAGVAAVWLLIFGLHLVAGSEPRPGIRLTSVTVSPELLAVLAEQRRLFSELLPLPEAPSSRRRDVPADRPRSQRRWQPELPTSQRLGRPYDRQQCSAYGVPALAGSALPFGGGSPLCVIQGETASDRLKPGLQTLRPSAVYEI
jgi:hypothetical protein